MDAAVGDRLVIRSAHTGGPVRDGEILEVPHQDGSPPYRVRWADTGHESLVFPGPDAFVQHLSSPPKREKAMRRSSGTAGRRS